MSAAATTVGILKTVLTADTSNFAAGMRTAAAAPAAVEKSVTGLTSQVAKLTPQAERMVKAFQGDKLLYQANNLVTAIEKLGGAQNLTAREMAAVNRQMGEAIAKAKLLGQTVPSSMTQLEQATRKASAPTSALTSKIAGMSAALGAVAAGAALMAGKQVIDFAGQLTDLSAKTGISTTGLQKLQLAFEQSGVSLDTVTGNVTRLQKALIEGDKGPVAVLQKLGQSLTELKAMAPEQAFITVADAIGKIQNPAEKAFAAMTIFGKGGSELLAGLDGHLAETTKRFEDMGLILSEETVMAADAFGDQLGLIGKQLLGVLGNALGPMLPALSALASGFSAVAKVLGDVLGFALKGVTELLVLAWQGIADLLANLGELAQRIPIVGKHLGFLSGATNWLHQSVAKADNMLYRLAFSTTNAGESATKAQAPLLGLGNHVELVGKKAEWTTAQLARMAAQTALFDAADRRVELGAAVLSQDMVRQGVKKPEPAKLLDPNAGALATNDTSGLRNILSTSAALRGEGTRQFTETINIWRQRWQFLQDDLTGGFADSMSRMLTGLRGFKDSWLDIWGSIRQSFANILSGMVSDFVGGFLRKIVGVSTGMGGGGLFGAAANVGGAAALGGLVGGGAAAATSAGGWALGAGTLTLGGEAAGVGTAATAGAGAAGGGFGATVAGLATNPFTIAAAGGLLLGLGIWKKGWFRGGEEATQVSPRRDQFFGQMGGFAAMSSKLTQALVKRGVPEAGNKASGMMAAVNFARTLSTFRSAEQPIVNAFHLAGFANVKGYNFGGFVAPHTTQAAILHGGSMGEIVAPVDKLMQAASAAPRTNIFQIEIHALDGADVDRVVRGQVIPRLKRALELNQDDYRGHTKRVLA